MTLWIAIAALTALAVLSVLVPLGRPRPVADAKASELAVYRDQWEEIERDRERGLIDGRDAEATKAEIGRRLLGAARSAGPAEAPDGRGTGRRRVAAALAILGVPALSLGLYAGLGSPGLPAQPLSARLSAPPEQQDIGALVTTVEAHLRAEPGDGRGWEVIAPIYLGLGRAGDAARAFSRAIELLGETASRQIGLGEALVAEANGVVTEAARAAFQRAAALAPQEPGPRYHLAVAKAQEGDMAGAIADWRALLAEAPEGAPWRTALAERIASAEASSRRAGD